MNLQKRKNKKKKSKTTFRYSNTKMIEDKKNLNNFGVLFHDARISERFQDIMGMEGRQTVEYQHHYHALVGRLEVDNQRLDMAIPVALYTYEQKVSGAHISFDLSDVEEAGDLSFEAAKEKVKELQETELYKFMNKMGMKFMLVAQNSVHVHPDGINGFSGTDYQKDMDRPGVVFPLSFGKDLPNFASIIQHEGKDEKANIMHTEYRVFNGDDDSAVYEQGRCITLIKGIEKPKSEEVEEEPDGLIDKMFGTHRYRKPPPKTREAVEPKIILDEIRAEGNTALLETVGEMEALWNASDFLPSTEYVLGAHIVKENRIGYGIGGVHGSTNKRRKTIYPSYNEQAILDFDDYDEEYEDDETFMSQYQDMESPAIRKMKRELMEAGLLTFQESSIMTEDELEEAYEIYENMIK